MLIHARYLSVVSLVTLSVSATAVSAVDGPEWTAAGGQTLADFGAAVQTAGDINGDGLSDLIVGAPFHDNADKNEGRVYIYLGQPDGLDPSLFVTMEGNQDSARFGSSVAAAGDVNGDGYGDVIVGAPGYRSDALDELAEGAAFLFLGSPDPSQFASPKWMLIGDQKAAHFGTSVSSAGDVNGDGFSDVIIGEPDYDTEEIDGEGRAHLFLGGPTGLASSAAWVVEGGEAEGPEFSSSALGISAGFGMSVSTAGDANGDGYGDVIVGSPCSVNPVPVENEDGEEELVKSGAVFAFYGGPQGLPAAPSWSAYPADEEARRYGASVATAGDVNGDGFADVVVGVRETGAGGYAYLGSLLGLGDESVRLPSGVAIPSEAGVVHTTGDRNADGYADVVVGLPSDSFATVFLGGPSGLSVDDAFASTATSDRFGVVGPAGDMNGDGFGDLVVGAPGALSAGEVYVYSGGPSDESTATRPILSRGADSWHVDGADPGAQLGFSVAHAGDVNGDGLGDIVVGAPNDTSANDTEGFAFVYHGKTTGLFPDWAWSAGGIEVGSHFGAAVSGAGDVNADGYADVIVSAPDAPSSSDPELLKVGRISIYTGGPAGLADDTFAVEETTDALAQMGTAVASAGDINGDGYADVLAGAPRQGLDGGGVFGFHGGPSGITRAWEIYSPAEFGPSSFGASVSTAGDVNRDGFLDVLIGAPQFGKDFDHVAQGRAEVYLGGPIGHGLEEDWSVIGDVAGYRVGTSVAGAGDVNSDGYDDVAIGVPGAPFGGQVHVYLGGPNGLSESIGILFEGDDIEEPGLGTLVSAAGDVDNDGIPDIVAGYSSSRISLLESGPGGKTITDSTHLGDALAGGGDINGDGFADVVVGRPAYAAESSLVDAGRIEVHFGNGRAGRSLNAHQRKLATELPIAHRGTVSAQGISLGAIGRTPFGRGQVRLAWEIAEVGVDFGSYGTAYGVAPSWTDTGVEGSPIEGLTGTLPVTTKGGVHWRARIQYNPVTTPFAPASHWLTLTENGWSQSDLQVTDTFQSGRVSVNDTDLIGVDFELGSGSSPAPVFVEVANTGDGPLTWTATAEPPVPWLALSNSGAAGQQPYDPAIFLGLSFLPDGLPDGLYATSIKVVNASNEEDFQSIPVAFTVAPKGMSPGDKLDGFFPEDGGTQGAVSFFGLKGTKLQLIYSHTSWPLKTRTTLEAPMGESKSFSVQHKSPSATKKKFKLKEDGVHTLRFDALKGWYGYTIMTQGDLPKSAKSYKVSKKQKGSSGKATFEVRALPGATVACTFTPENNFTGPMTLSVRDPSGNTVDVGGFQQALGGGLQLSTLPLPSGGCYTLTVSGFKKAKEKVTGQFKIKQPAVGNGIVEVPIVPGS